MDILQSRKIIRSWLLKHPKVNPFKIFIPGIFRIATSPIRVNPDFFINIISKISEAKNNNTIGIGIGSGGRNGGFGISGGIPIGGKKLNEEFIIEFVNAKTDEIIWEGILNSTIKEKRKPEEKEMHFKEIIKKIVEKYPPKKKN